MAIDAGIFQNYLRPPKTMQEYDNEAMQAQDNALSLQAKRMQMNALAQQQQQEEGIRNYLGSGAKLNTPDGIAGLYRVAGSKAGAILKNQSELAKDQAAVDKDKIESGLKVWQSYRDQSSMIRTPEEAAAWITNGYHDPVIGPYLQRTGSLEEGIARIPRDPAGFEQWRNGVGMNVDKLATHALQQKQFEEAARHNLSTERTAQGQLGVAQGQLGVARDRLKFDKQKDAQGGAGNASEDERKAAGWYSQATNAWNNMQAAMGGVDPKTGQFKNEDVARPGIADAIAAIPSFGMGEVVGNSMRTADRQKFIQAASSMSEALLRAATGAGVNRDEAQQKIRELTPVFGEDPETTKQKMESIPMYLGSLKARAGRAIPKQQQSGGVVDFGSLK